VVSLLLVRIDERRTYLPGIEYALAATVVLLWLGRRGWHGLRVSRILSCRIDGR
jgi:hypothetical protein